MTSESELVGLLTEILHTIGSAPRASFGSIGNTMEPQIDVAQYRAWMERFESATKREGGYVFVGEGATELARAIAEQGPGQIVEVIEREPASGNAEVVERSRAR